MSEPSDAPAPRTGTHLHDLLGPWVPHQRWYPAKGREARLDVVGTLELPAAGAAGSGADAGDVRVYDHIARIVDASPAPGTEGGTELVQIPLVHRRAARGDADAGAHLLGTLTDAGGTWHVYDGPHDPAFTDALLAALGGQVRAVGVDADGHRAESAGSAAGRRPPAGPPVPPPGSPARVLRGEQSNTSIIVEPAEGAAVIVKVFRTLHPGSNPDVEVQAALSAAGVAAVPALSAWLAGTWPTGEPTGESTRTPRDGSGGSGGDGSGTASGDLAVASEFLAGAQDAWREAVAAVVAGADFSPAAAALGAATAEVHRAMAEQLPTRAATAGDAADLADAMTRRAQWALDAAPALAVHAGALQAALASWRAHLTGSAGDAPDPTGPSASTPSSPSTPSVLPDLQRIHGDYHLGQVLHLPGRGWVLLDFEGEPLRPLAERTLPDLALRDVAGMLRSFDYAARQGGAARGGEPEHLEQAGAWAAAAREAFLHGYAGASGSDPRADPALLDALELDKALYEVVYETRNRPDWLSVPLDAVGRLLARLA